MQKGFTLVELLVVVAIIGLLSSVTLASIDSARDKARVAAGKQLATFNDRTFGDQLVYALSFGEGSGTTVANTASNLSDAALINGPAWRTSAQCDLGMGSCIYLDGSNDYVAMPAQLRDPSVVSGGVTISIWIYPTRNNVSIENVWARIAGTHHLTIRHGASGIAQYMTRRGVANWWPTSSGRTPVDKWSHFILVVEPGVGERVYRDGAEVYRSASTATSLINYGGTASIGLPSHGWSYFQGMVDEFRVYSGAFDSDQVASLHESQSQHLAQHE